MFIWVQFTRRRHSLRDMFCWRKESRGSGRCWLERCLFCPVVPSSVNLSRTELSYVWFENSPPPPPPSSDLQCVCVSVYRLLPQMFSIMRFLRHRALFADTYFGYLLIIGYSLPPSKLHFSPLIRDIDDFLSFLQHWTGCSDIYHQGKFHIDLWSISCSVRLTNVHFLTHQQLRVVC